MVGQQTLQTLQTYEQPRSDEKSYVQILQNGRRGQQAHFTPIPETRQTEAGMPWRIIPRHASLHENNAAKAKKVH